MKVTKVGSRGYVFTFYELKATEFDCITNVYVIDGKNNIFICDTFLGPKAMEKIMDYINKNFILKSVVVFNSHSDWDHIWGNCYFKDSIIISHLKCRDNIIINGDIELNKYKNLTMGDVGIKVPNMTFKEELCFYDDEVKFFYSKGHTMDSSSCFDIKDGILYVGDNIEYPKPYITCDNLPQYKETLEKYKKIKTNKIISGHSDININGYNLLIDNLEYITNLI